MIRWLLALVLLTQALPAGAQQVASPAIRAGAEQLVTMLRDAKADEAMFAPAFLAQVPAAQVEAIARDLRNANGTVIGIASVTPESAPQAVVAVEYSKAIVTVRFALEGPEPHRFIGLLIAGVDRRGDSFEAVIGDLKKLPGTSSLLVAKLGETAPVAFAGYNEDVPFATGSMFKLYVLAELARATQARERSWQDVIALGPPSLPSGVTQNWPKALPITLATLATQMISISDNTAADTLIATLGRAKVDAMRASIGTTPGSLPVLTTLEAFTLKMPASEAPRKRWVAGALAERREVLSTLEPSAAAIDATALAGAPLHIDMVEWPATMTEMAGVFDYLRRSDSAMAMSILGVNPALPPSDRARFDVVGYKGGSESGVIAMGWLLRTKSGDWYVVTGAWNDPVQPVQAATFAALMTRAIALVGK